MTRARRTAKEHPQTRTDRQRDVGPEGTGGPPRHRSAWWAVYLPLLLGTLVRVAVVEDVRFTGEEALFYSEACKIAGFTELPWYGPRMSGSGYHPGPLFFAVCAPPLWVSRDPVVVHLWLIMLNALGILLLGRLTLRLLGDRAAFIVVGLLSSSPWQFVYSIGIWQPHVTLPLFALTLWALERMCRRPRSRSVALLVPVLLASFQIHPSCVFLWVIAAAFVLVYRTRINTGCFALGLLATLILYTPYLAHELGNHFENTRRVASDVQQYPWSMTNPLRSVWYHFMMTSSNILFHVKQGYWAPVPETLAEDLREYWRSWDPALDKLGRLAGLYRLDNIVSQFLAGVIALTWCVLLGRTIRRLKPRECDPLTFVFLLCPIVVFAVVLLGRKPVYPNYILFVLPAPFVGYALLDRAITGLVKSKLNLAVPLLVGALFVPRLAVAYAYTDRIDSSRGLGTQKAFARWVAERGRVENVRNFGWNNRGVKEEIACTIARCAEPELLNRQPAAPERFTLAPEVLSTDAARADYVARRVKGRVAIVDYQLNRNNTFLAWRN